MAVRDRVIEAVELRNADLAGLRADGLTLRDVDLRAATLSGVEWLACTLSDVRMIALIGRGAIFRMCTFERVHAAECDLTGAKLENSHAPGLVLDRATLSGGSLVDTDLTRATLRGADLRDVDASGAILRGADLRDADLRGASLSDADLRGADLRGARIDDVDLDGADLRGGLLDGSHEEPPDPVEGPGAMPPPMSDLLAAVGPLVVGVLQRGNSRGVLDDAALGRLLADVGSMGVDATTPGPLLDEPIRQVLQRVSTTGLSPLIAALCQRGNDPPPEVVHLITSLIGEAKLGPNATAEDLVVHLVAQLQSSIPPK